MRIWNVDRKQHWMLSSDVNGVGTTESGDELPIWVWNNYGEIRCFDPDGLEIVPPISMRFNGDRAHHPHPKAKVS